MPLFCKQCNGRRFPRWMKVENMTLWFCETCENFTDAKDIIIREDISKQLPCFSNFSLPKKYELIILKTLEDVCRLAGVSQ